MGKTPAQDLAVMRDAVFFEGSTVTQKLSRFWILLVLASIIASAGVVGDSTETVIGAMIVAPLMIPIQGVMLSVVTGDRANLARSFGLVLAGAATAVAIGYVVGLTVVNDIVAATNSQVASRVSPKLIDLLAACATGVVGSIALARRDISDTLPGVAIAISLVPPLSVVGLTLESGAAEEAWGALLLFLTNVVAILASGTVVMAMYGVWRMHSDQAVQAPATLNRRNAVAVIAAMVLIVGIPLTLTSVSIAQSASEQAEVRDACEEWAASVGWELMAVEAQAGKIVARFEGPNPIPPTDDLSEVLLDYGADPDHVRVELVPRETIDLDA
jgi:uncharacterized hydrophobic protein (TIGR00271 family)